MSSFDSIMLEVNPIIRVTDSDLLLDHSHKAESRRVTDLTTSQPASQLRVPTF